MVYMKTTENLQKIAMKMDQANAKILLLSMIILVNVGSTHSECVNCEEYLNKW